MAIDKNMLPLQTQAAVTAYKGLPVRTQTAILSSICKLVEMEATGHPPSKEAMQALLTETGELDIAIACYSAQLLGIKWR